MSTVSVQLISVCPTGAIQGPKRVDHVPDIMSSEDLIWYTRPGVTGQTITNWESTKGAIRPQPAKLAGLVRLHERSG